MAEKKYIELQKALNVCEMHYEHCLEMHDWSGDATADNIKRDIETIPTADVVEVKHGEWVFSRKEWGSSDYSQDVYYKCSICGKEYEEFDIDEANYCSNCGAKMDGGNAE